ncbi:cysteine desulfurase family protein [uncultured Acetobacteroides sp.]|uniref:cysteine desulfurase family protein n=1 Tax=uncultured Acetobacteroides sp. TaxID=1760811 RepID=UPI0029F4B3D5|nr:cysteine desulfurase family protein [uncultured Acetobacteroides sp.]
MSESKAHCIYLDNAATTPLDKRVFDEMARCYMDDFGNASSLHSFGTQAKALLESCRSRLAKLINANPDEIVFTSGGTEANNLALKGIAFANRHRGNHIIVSQIEHDCVLNACKWLETQGFFVSYLPVDGDGVVDLERLSRLINAKTILVSVMHANNEIGTIQPIAEIGRICRERGVFLHTDACQSFGKVPVDVVSLGVTLMSLNAHKIYGPKGVGCLYVKRGTAITPLLHGGGQEFGIRSTTENLPGVVGFAKAAELCISEMEVEAKRLSALCSRTIDVLQHHFDGFYVNGSMESRLSGYLNFAIGGLEGETIRLLLLLDEEGIAVSAGSACSNNDSTHNASHVLQAIGRDQFQARGAIRIGFGRFNSEEDVDAFIRVLVQKVEKLNSIFSL